MTDARNTRFPIPPRSSGPNTRETRAGMLKPGDLLVMEVVRVRREGGYDVLNVQCIVAPDVDRYRVTVDKDTKVRVVR